MQRTKINRKETENVKRFGVELELTNVNRSVLIAALQLKGIDCHSEGYNHNTRPYWKLTSDSSIRGDDTAELVSPILYGMEGLKQLREVCLTLYFIDAQVNSSCGLHVHHENPNLDTNQLTNLMKFYARLERTIDAFMPVSRKRNENRFCHSMIEAYQRTSWQQLDQLGRYYKLNFQSLRTHNTIEFRQHQGTIEFEKIYHWVCFTANFITYCKDKVSRSAMNFIERAWTPKHLNLSKRTWAYYKERMKKLDDLNREEQCGQIRLVANG